MLLKFAQLLGFHSATTLTTPAQWSELDRKRDELRWLAYDEPTYMRRAREETENERNGRIAA